MFVRIDEVDARGTPQSLEKMLCSVYISIKFNNGLRLSLYYA